MYASYLSIIQKIINLKNMNTKAQAFIENLSPDLKKIIIEIAEDIKPAIDAIHAQAPTTQNYYGDYMRLLSYKPKHAKLMGLAMLYAGVNPQGLEAAMKNI